MARRSSTGVPLAGRGDATLPAIAAAVRDHTSLVAAMERGQRAAGLTIAVIFRLGCGRCVSNSEWHRNACLLRFRA
jgi:hypothetical protein